MRRRIPAAIQDHGPLPALAACLMLVASIPAAGQESGTLEYAVKAAYLYKFGPFVEWPVAAFESATSAMNVCVVGYDPFGDVLDETMRGQRIGERPVAVLRLATVDRDSGCHILYAAGSDAQPVADILAAVSGAPVLTFTDAARDPREKGIIHYVIHENRVRFEIDDQSAAENGLTISSKVLSLALSVVPRA